MKILIIVESLTKAKKIQGFLGNDYIVKASFGHIRDLKNDKDKNDIGIDVNNNFKPEYSISKAKIVKELKDSQKYCNDVILASDLDREGEAIAWHLADVLKLNNPKRIVFNNISKKSILDSLKNPKNIDMKLVHSQQARQVLDKLVGFDLSPLLWKHVTNALSAGRVQSVTTRLVIDREKDIDKFESHPYYKTTAIFTNGLEGDLNKNFEENKQAIKFLEDCKSSTFTIEDIEKKRVKRYPSAPFRTSTLQQEAGRKLNMSAKIIMNNAQTLYENGFITYHRTDSVELSPEAMKSIKTYILDNYGDKYLNIRKYKTKTQNAQEAHECIRPTDINKENIEDSDLSPSQKKLYQIIWKRTVASQMSPCEVDVYTVTVDISNRSEKFICKAEKVIFLGFRVVYDYKDVDNDSDNEDIDKNKMDRNLKIIISLKKGEKLDYKTITSTEKFTKSIGRYSEATLVKKMEDLGIGRPSTIASTISKIQERKYVIKETRKGKKVPYKIYTLKEKSITESEKETTLDGEKNKLFPTDLGKEVTDFLLKNFKNILDYKFTSNVEKELDEIAHGNKVWNNVVKNFYDNYHPDVEILMKQEGKASPKKETQKRLVGKEQSTGKNIYAYVGKFGPVLQIGDNKDNIRFVSIKENYTVSEITEAEANQHLQYPKTLGSHDGKDIIIKDGKFGYYIFYDNKNYTINKEDKKNINLDEAIEIIKEKDNKTIKVFNKTTRINNGQYGPYIIHGKKLVSVPKEIDDPSKLTLEEVKTIVTNYKPKSSPTKKTINKTDTKKRTVNSKKTKEL